MRPTSSGALATVFTVSATLSKILQATESKEWMGLCHFRSTGVAVVSTNLKKYLKVSSLVDRVICTSLGLAFYRNRRIKSRVWLNRWRCRTFARPYVFSAYEMADETTGKLVTRETISTWNTSFSFTLDVIPLLCACPLVLENSNPFKVALNWNEFHQLGYLQQRPPFLADAGILEAKHPLHGTVKWHYPIMRLPRALMRLTCFKRMGIQLRRFQKQPCKRTLPHLCHLLVMEMKMALIKP